MDSKEREDIEKKLGSIYDTLESSDVPSGYEWPSFVEATGNPPGGTILASLQVALRALVWTERKRNEDEKKADVLVTDESFAIPFSVLYSMYETHFKRYLPDVEVPSVFEVTGAFIKEANESQVHEAPKEIQ